jgi:RNA polymerase sigma-70 factor, ECF subfamily
LPFAPGDEDEVRLVRALVAADEQARAALFERYGAHIQTVLEHLVGYGELERADLLHDVFIRAFEHVADLKNPRSLKQWLTRIAIWTTQEWFRRRKRAAREEPLENAKDRAATPLQPEARQALRAFYELMDRFDADERSVFVLRFVEGMTLQEVAELHDVSLSTAHRRICRAELRFRRMLHRYPALLERLTESSELGPRAEHS